MRLQHISVQHLFGIYSYELPIDWQPLTMWIGPNGSGKTVLMKIVSELLCPNSSPHTLAAVPFEQIQLRFHNGDTLTATKDRLQKGQVQLSYESTGRKVEAAVDFAVYNPLPVHAAWLYRLQSYFFQPLRYLDVRLLHGPTANQYIAQYPQRLMAFIQQVMNQSVNVLIRQQLAFNPLASLHPSAEQVTSADLMAVLQQLQVQLKNLQLFGILEDDLTLHLPPTSTTHLQAQYDYLKNLIEELDCFNNAIERLLFFQTILSSHLMDKQVLIDRQYGLRVVHRSGTALPLTALSSGEQQLVILLFECLFNVPNNTLLLIDEPDLSLNAAWMTQLMDDFKHIARLLDNRIVIASHSLQLLEGHKEFAVLLNPHIPQPVD
jgi:energy-coupling factor transporter ATP-binding protein EcfA2